MAPEPPVVCHVSHILGTTEQKKPQLSHIKGNSYKLIDCTWVINLDFIRSRGVVTAPVIAPVPTKKMAM